MSSASLSSQHDRPFLSTSFPSTLPTPFGPLSPSAYPSASFPSDKPRLRTIYLLLYRTDHLLNRLTSILSTPAGTDTLLATTFYTLQFVHANLNALLAAQLRALASRVVKNAENVLAPGETLIASLPAPRVARLLARVSASAKSLADVVGDYRVFVRLWGLLGIYQWGKRIVFDPPDDRALLRISLAQVGVNAVYQILENLAYLGQKGIVRRSERHVRRDWLWSGRLWGAHVVLDLVRLARLRMLWDQDGVLGSRGEQQEEDDDKEGKAKRKEMVDRWWRELMMDICYAPLTVHWSVEGGTLSEGWVGLLGAMAGAIALRDMWSKAS